MNKKVERIGVLILVVVVLGFFFGGGAEKQAANNMRTFSNTFASEIEAQYQIAKRQGDTMQICIQAGAVSGAFLGAKDEPNYRKWKDIQKVDCAVAGIPSM